MKPEFSGAEWSKVGGKLKSATDSTHLRMRTGAQVTFNPFARNPSHRSFLFSRFQSFSSELALAHDPLVTPASSMGMPAAHRYLYEQPYYGHQGIINDPSPATNARRQEITTGSPVVQSGVPHSLRAIFLATGATISREG